MSFVVSSLLPAGLYDLLPPDAAHERFVSGALLGVFDAFGYEQVSPPLMEFEASLLAGEAGKALSAQTFRVMDAYSQAMMGFRADMTLQIGRIAASRLQDSPRPLRLSYGGSTLRIKGEGRQKARQWRQAGIELIGTQGADADAEVIAVAVYALQRLDVQDVVVDVNLPGLVLSVLEAAHTPQHQHEAILQAVQCKDTGALAALNADISCRILCELIDAVGVAKDVLPRLAALDLPKSACEQISYIQNVIVRLRQIGCMAEVTVDAVENRGFEYHSIISFSLFSKSRQIEVGRGGRYSISHAHGAETATATGTTLYVNTLMEVVPQELLRSRMLISTTQTLEDCQKWHEKGFITVRSHHKMDVHEAHRLACSHVLVDDVPLAVIGNFKI